MKKDKWDLLKDWIKEHIEKANEILNNPKENWDQDYDSIILGRKFQLEETLKQMEKLKK